MEEGRLPKKVIKWNPPERRKRGKPKATWAEGIRGLMGGKGINLLTPNVNYSGRTAPLTSKFAFYVFIHQV